MSQVIFTVRNFAVVCATVACISLTPQTANAQGGRQQRRAQIVGNGNSDRGKCTIEVVVDGAAEVEIRGDSAVLRDVSGRPPEWRRFECTGPLPANPAEFRFAGVDGRGRQQLVSDPRNGGVAVVRIEDPQGGAEGYTFDLFWTGAGGPNSGPGGPGYGRDDRRYDPQGVRNGQYGRPANDEAIRACQDAVRQQAAQRFNTADIRFERTDIADNPGGRDGITGSFAVRRGNYGRDEIHQFSCAVNLENGRLRAVQIDAGTGGYAPEGRPGYGPGSPQGGYAPSYDRNASSNSQVMQQCERAVQDRVRRDGYESADVQSMNADDRGGRGALAGSVRAYRGNGYDTFDFSCVVNQNNGSVRSVDLRRR